MDEQCIQILSNCHKALPPNGKVVIIEFTKPENPEPTIASRFLSSMDNIMFLTDGGKERTLKEYESLGKRSRFVKFQSACRVFSVLEVIELYKWLSHTSIVILQVGGWISCVFEPIEVLVSLNQLLLVCFYSVWFRVFCWYIRSIICYLGNFLYYLSSFCFLCCNI